jgi:WD40 repeat protein
MDGQPVFFSGAGDGMVVKWDLNQPNQGQLVARMDNSVYALHCIPEKNLLIVGHNYQGIHIIDLHENKEQGSLSLTDSAIFDIKHAGNLLLVATGSGAVYTIDLNELRIVQVLDHADKSARCIQIDTKRSEFAVGYSDHAIRIFDLVSLQLKHRLTGHTNSVFTVAYHPGERLLVSAGRDAHIKVWDQLNEYAPVQSVAAHMYAINHIEFSPNGELFVTCSMDKSIKVWDAYEFKLLKVIDKARHMGHGTSVNKLYWSHYDQLLVSCSDDRTISVWDLKY